MINGTLNASGQPTFQHGDQRLYELLNRIATAVTRADTITIAFTGVLEHIGRFIDWPLAHVYFWSEANDAFVSSGIWYAADSGAYAALRELSEATQFRPGEGPIGQVAERRQAVVILDGHDEGVFKRQGALEKGDIRAYFAFPVLVDGDVISVLEFFSPTPEAPDPDMALVANHAAALLGLAIQRQQALSQLQESEALSAEAQRAAGIGHWEWDMGHNQMVWSPEVYRIFGLSPAGPAATFETFLTQVHPDDFEYVRKKMQDAYQRGQSFDFFHRIVCPDGSMKVLHERGRPLYDQAGSVMKLKGTVGDMTLLKKTELKLAQKVRQLSALMEIGQTISATLDLEAIYERVLTLVRTLIEAEALLLFLHKEDKLEVVALDQQDLPGMHGARIPLDSGLAGQVWRSGTPLLVKGKARLQRLAPEFEQRRGYQPETMLVVPIRWQDEVLAVLEAAHRDENAFDEDDLQLLETAAAWTAIAIGNARQYEHLQRQLNESKAIAAISQALTETLELDVLLQVIVDQVQRTLPQADWTIIHLLQPGTNRLVLAASAGLTVSESERVAFVDKGIFGRVMAEGSLVNVADVQTDPLEQVINLDPRAHSLLVAPVESSRESIGTISIQCVTPAAFTADDERMLAILGVQAGMAIQNSRLYAAQIAAREKAEGQREQIRRMAQKLLKAQEDERARIARELHDESGQSLTSLKISLDLIRSQLPENMVELKENLGELLELTDKTMDNIRFLSYNLRPPGLDAYGLNAALAGLCEDFETHTQLSVLYEGVELPELEELAALTLYRFAQEALTNVARHAEATEVEMTLSKESGAIVLTVVDNGLGFTPPDLDEGVHVQTAGLVGMKERLKMVDGRLTIESGLAKGSRLTAVVPFLGEET